MHGKAKWNTLSFVRLEVDTGLLGNGIEAVLFNGANGGGGEAEVEEFLAGLPPNLLVLQIHKLQFLCAVLWKWHKILCVRSLPCELAYPAWNKYKIIIICDIYRIWVGFKCLIRASCPYLRFQSPNNQSEPLNMISILKCAWRPNFILFLELFLLFS